MNVEKVAVGDNLLLKDVSMHFIRGDVVGIIGESGRGKSTLAKLIMKFRASDGINVDGTPIADIQNSEYRRRVSYYSQETPIISDTIINNLNFGREQVPETTYRKLGFLDKFANLHEFIYKNGANLSGGDKQRISLARFFVEDSDIVVLDEPTSSLDKQTENEILSAIINRNADKIIFLITHNNECMRYCTHIARIHNGTIEVVENIENHSGGER